MGRMAVLLALAVPALAGCGSSSHTTDTVGTPTGAPSPAALPQAARTAESATTAAADTASETTPSRPAEETNPGVEEQAAMRAERLCRLYREYQQTDQSEARQILEAIGRVAPEVTTRGSGGEPTGLDKEALQEDLAGSACQAG